MRRLLPLSPRVACTAIAALLVVLTSVFVTVPYALGAHPWESQSIAASQGPARG